MIPNSKCHKKHELRVIVVFVIVQYHGKNLIIFKLISIWDYYN